MIRGTDSSSDTGCKFVDAGPGPLRWSTLDTPVGELTLIGESDGVLRRICFGGVPERAARMKHDAEALSEAAEQIEAYFGGGLRRFELQLAPAGTEFQRLVWRALALIPFATTRTYADIAKAVGSPGAMRAVGAANGANPLPIVVPCHRVIGADSRLVGFGGGLDRKAALLCHEGHEVSAGRVVSVDSLF